MDLAPNTERILVCHTGYVPQATAKALDDGDNRFPNLILYQHADHGWMLCIPTKLEDMPILGEHKELSALMRFAQSHGYHWVLMDSAGDPLPDESGLPTFDW